MKPRELHAGVHYRTRANGVVRFKGYDMHGFLVCFDAAGADVRLLFADLVARASPPTPAGATPAPLPTPCNGGRP